MDIKDKVGGALAKIEPLAKQYPFYLGSGVTTEQVAQIPSYMTGMIVGTALKKDGKVHNVVDLKRTQDMKSHIDVWQKQKVTQ